MVTAALKLKDACLLLGRKSITNLDSILKSRDITLPTKVHIVKDMVFLALWWVNGGLLQEGLCHTQVCCTQSPCPHSSPLLTHPSSGDTQTQFCLSLCGVSGSLCAEGMFEPSEHLWRVWGLILNVISPFLPSYLHTLAK